MDKETPWLRQYRAAEREKCKTCGSPVPRDHTYCSDECKNLTLYATLTCPCGQQFKILASALRVRMERYGDYYTPCCSHACHAKYKTSVSCKSSRSLHNWNRNANKRDDVVGLRSHGVAIEDIATKLGLSVNTVRNYIYRQAKNKP